MSDTFFIDTNVLMYAVGSPHALKQPCLNIVRRIADGEITAVTDVEVFQEIAYRYWAQRKWDVARQVFEDYRTLFSEILSVETTHLESYYALLTRYPLLSPRDAIHVAVMQANHLQHMYSADKAFQDIPHLHVHAP